MKTVSLVPKWLLRGALKVIVPWEPLTKKQNKFRGKLLFLNRNSQILFLLRRLR